MATIQEDVVNAFLARAARGGQSNFNPSANAIQVPTATTELVKKRWAIPAGVDAIQQRSANMVYLIGPGGMFDVSALIRSDDFDGVRQVTSGGSSLGYQTTTQVGALAPGALLPEALETARQIHMIGSYAPVSEAGLGLSFAKSIEDLVKPDPYANVVFALYQKNFLTPEEFTAKEPELKAAVLELYFRKYPAKRPPGMDNAALQARLPQSQAGGFPLELALAGAGGILALGLGVLLIKRAKKRKAAGGGSSKSNILPFRKVAGLGGAGKRRRSLRRR